MSDPAAPADPAPNEAVQTTADGRLVTREQIDLLLPILMDELRRAARSARRRFAAGETMATTALLNEAWLRLARSTSFEDHGHYLRVACVVMRRILTERVRRQLTQKRGGDFQRVPLDDAEDFEVEDDEEVAAVHEALSRLSQVSPRLAAIVECRFFGGLTEPQTAEALGISERTVQRDWATARAWLQRELKAGGG